MKKNLGSLLIGVVALSFCAVYSTELGWTAWRMAGMAIAFPSFALLALARIQLGKAFSVRAKATSLVTTGLYSRIRNPIYIFGGLTLAGVAIWSEQPWLLLCFVLLVPMQFKRIRNEERVLEAKFGSAYLEYKRKTWF